jgi:pSer/pThr/pTyr-binding forkhead associated (FHA) protein
MIKVIVKAQTETGVKEYNYEFDQPVVTIGRLKENDIPLPLSTVSGYHAQIEKEGDNCYLTDRGSINGTFLNDERLESGEKKLLNDGDTIRIQNFDLYFSTGITMMNIQQGATVQIARQMVMEVLGSWQTETQEKPRIIVMGGPDNGKQYELNEGKVLTAGRTQDCDIMVEHPSVSRKHAEISLTWSGAFIKDLNSANGVFVDDQRISGAHKLRDREEVRLGQQTSSSPIVLVFSNPAEALLSKIDDMPSGEVSLPPAAAEEAAGPSPPVQEAGLPTAPAAEEVPPDEGMEYAEESSLPPPPPPETRKGGFPLAVALVGGAILIAIVATAIILFSGKPDETLVAAQPSQGSTGDVIAVVGPDLNSSDVKSAEVMGIEAPILKRGEHRVEIRLPRFAALQDMETKADIVLNAERREIARVPFVLIMPLRIESIHPNSGDVGTEVHIRGDLPSAQASVLFGDTVASIRSWTSNEAVAVVPRPSRDIPPEGLKLPVRLKINQRTSNDLDFLVVVAPPKPEERFALIFTAKPYGTNLGFNEYAVQSNIGDFLVLVSKDEYPSSRDRAEATAGKLNEAIDFFRNNAEARVALDREGDNFALYAEAGAERKLLLRVFPEDALCYTKINQRPVGLEELATWWQMLINAYYNVFVQVRDPSASGILSAGGTVFRQIYEFYPVGSQEGEKYYKKEFLSDLPADQRNRLLRMSLTLPYRVASVEGKWIGTMSNILYSNISETNLELILMLRQRGEAVSGRAEVNWKIVLGQNVAYKKLGTHEVKGAFRRTNAFPLEFSFVEKDGRRLDFAGKIEGDILRGKFSVRSTGEDGNWSVRLQQ